MDDSGATENITQDTAGFKHYVPATARQSVEGAGGIILPVAKNGYLYLLVDSGIEHFKAPWRLDRAAHAPIFGSTACS